MSDSREQDLQEIDRLKKELAGVRAESERWYQAFLLAVKERDLALKELRVVR